MPTRFLLTLLPILAACAAGPAPAEPGAEESLLPGSVGVLVARKDQGVVVTGVSSAAAEAGVREGDVILRYNGIAVQNPREFNRLVLDSKPRSTARIELLRGGAVHVLHLRVRQLDTMPRA
jgi:S1-C subfamily serine protease